LGDESDDAPLALMRPGQGATGGTQMNDEPRAKRRPHEHEHSTHQDKREAVRAPHNDRDERKPTEEVRGDWRGAGVCGDRHTD
jgi:hypothetical protein